MSEVTSRSGVGFDLQATQQNPRSTNRSYVKHYQTNHVRTDRSSLMDLENSDSILQMTLKSGFAERGGYDLASQPSYNIVNNPSQH